MRKVIVAVVVVLVVAIVAAAMFMLDGRASRAEPVVEGERAASPPTVAVSSSPVAERPIAVERARSEARAEREAMRRRILDAMQARERAASEREGGSSGDGGESSGGAVGSRAGAEAGAPDDEPDDDSAKVGTVVDKTGDHAEHVKVVNEDLIPLADECYALARETQPELAGLLVLDFEIIGDEDIGGVIESVQLGQGNELVDPGLVECVQESILATTLPPPEQGGRDAISLSLRLSPDEE